MSTPTSRESMATCRAQEQAEPGCACPQVAGLGSTQGKPAQTAQAFGSLQPAWSEHAAQWALPETVGGQQAASSAPFPSDVPEVQLTHFSQIMDSPPCSFLHYWQSLGKRSLHPLGVK